MNSVFCHHRKIIGRKGKEHEEIIKLGGIMSQHLQNFANKGESFTETISTVYFPLTLFQN